MVSVSQWLNTYLANHEYEKQVVGVIIKLKIRYKKKF